MTGEDLEIIILINIYLIIRSSEVLNNAKPEILILYGLG